MPITVASHSLFQTLFSSSHGAQGQKKRSRRSSFFNYIADPFFRSAQVHNYCFEILVLGCRRLLIYRWFAEGVKNQPYASRYTQFLENLKNIIPDGMLCQAEFESDLLVLHVFGYKPEDFTLPWGQQSVQPASARMHRLQIRYQLEEKLQLIVVGPNLSLVNGPDTLGQSFE
jgi:hypothetical protein